jgi:hypothetical protein
MPRIRAAAREALRVDPSVFIISARGSSGGGGGRQDRDSTSIKTVWMSVKPNSVSMTSFIS